MPALMEVLEREHRLGGLPRLAAKLCSIEADWINNAPAHASASAGDLTTETRIHLANSISFCAKSATIAATEGRSQAKWFQMPSCLAFIRFPRLQRRTHGWCWSLCCGAPDRAGSIRDMAARSQQPLRARQHRGAYRLRDGRRRFDHL